ncbi:response regulator [Arcobacter sp. LA11]|uniref:response regulator n=1 Tax=Arcobacter sp. LA11 TaxID=1898176 RepID=UPI000934D62A|nr:response regulator [Arcobacter sp. LA11]
MSELVYLKEKANNYSVLVVEDSIHIQKQMKNFLGKLFKEIYLAENGLVGLEVFKEKKPNLVLTDLTMPKMDGHEFVEELLKVCPKSKIIIVSAHGYEENVTKFKNMGVVGFIQKPIDFPFLIKSLIKAIDEFESELIDNNSKDIIFENKTLEKLNDIKRSGEKIELINSFKGLPLVHVAFISNMTSNTISLQTEAIQVKAIRYEKSTILEVNGTFIQASLYDYNEKNQELVFKDFIELDICKSDIMDFTVGPDELFNASIFYNSERFSYEPVALSSKSILFETKHFNEPFTIGDEVDIVMGFTTVYKAAYENEIIHKERLTCKGKILKIIQLPDSLTKVMCSLDFSLGNKKILEKYIYQREMNLIEEFKELKFNY